MHDKSVGKGETEPHLKSLVSELHMGLRDLFTWSIEMPLRGTETEKQFVSQKSTLNGQKITITSAIVFGEESFVYSTLGCDY